MSSQESLLKAFAGKIVGVIGDAMLDRFLFGNVQRISPEAPVPVVSIDEEVVTAGGAANVAANIASLGGKAQLVSLIGTDQDGKTLLRCAKKQGISCEHIIAHASRVTTQKARVVGGGQHIVRMDHEHAGPVTGALERQILLTIGRAMKSWDVVVVSDYAKGTITPVVGRGIISLALKYGKKVIVDTKPQSAVHLKGAFLFTPNTHEALAIAGTDDVHHAGQILQKKLQAKILITQGINGMTLFDGKKKTHIPAQAHTVFDVVGAGDTVVAVCALALAAGADLVTAAHIANVAAGIVVSKKGTATVSLGELRQRLA